MTGTRGDNKNQVGTTRMLTGTALGVTETVLGVAVVSWNSHRPSTRTGMSARADEARASAC